MNLKLEHSTIPQAKKWYGTILMFLPVILLFLLAINLVSGSVTSVGQETVRSIILATSNPFIGLFIGLLATALIQSSSTVTAMTVAIVSTGYLSLGSAIPIVMGANVGTTLTSTLVSLGFITNKNEFRKAISAGSVHDFFNILTVVLLFPLEYHFGFLSSAANYFTQVLGGALRVNSNESGSIFGLGAFSDSILTLFPNAIIVLILALIMLFVSIKLLSTIIYRRIIGDSKDRLKKYIFNSPYKSFGWGTLITAGIQSSSITTSLIVPLVASGRVTLRNAFPFILGANIGTTITALIAAFNQSEAALSLAFVHLLFNLFGVLIFLPFAAIRKLPVLMAYRFGALTLDSRIIGLSYIIFTFFLMPFTLIYINKDSSLQKTYTYATKEGNIEGKAMIVFNNEGLNSNRRYLLYQGSAQGVFLDTPVTSYLLPASSDAFVTPYQVIDNLGPKVQEESNMSSTYSNGELSILALRKMVTIDSHGQRTEYLIDPEKQILIELIKRDSLNNTLESIRLIDID